MPIDTRCAQWSRAAPAQRNCRVRHTWPSGATRVSILCPILFAFLFVCGSLLVFLSWQRKEGNTPWSPEGRRREVLRFLTSGCGGGGGGSRANWVEHEGRSFSPAAYLIILLLIQHTSLFIGLEKYSSLSVNQSNFSPKQEGA